MKKITLGFFALFIFLLTNAQIINTKWKGNILGDNPRVVMLDFKKDKFDIFTVSDSSLVETMSLVVDKNIFTVKKIDGQSDCDNLVVGKYEYSIRKDSMFIKKISDDCDDRSSALDNTKWAKWKNYVFIKVDESILKQYVGVYQLDANHQVTIGFENGGLYMESATNNLPKVPIYAISKTKFFLKIAAVEVDFVKDASGRVVKFISHEEKDYELKKIR